MSVPVRTRPAITVSIVSHGQLALIQPLLEQLSRFAHTSIAKVVLTHNVPENDILDSAQYGFPLERIRNTEPKGFGSNHNYAFSRCTTPWFLVLNPDIRLESDALAPLIAAAGAKSGILTPRILEPGKNDPEQHRNIITPLEILTRRASGYVQPKIPAWIPGLFMLFRAEAYAQINGFNERFFMYGEDFDICARVRICGWTLQVVDHVSATHDARRASHAQYRHLYWHVTSLLKVWMSATFWRYRRLIRQERRNV